MSMTAKATKDSTHAAMHIEQPGTHLDHLLRQTRLHHVQLSSMADVKANMLLTMASVVITLCLPHLTRPELRWPLVVLMGFSLLTIILATYATMPKQSLGFKPDIPTDVNSPRFNLLFFGDFVRLTYEDYLEAMEEMLNDPGSAYEAQVRELYNLGVFLAKKKYRYVRLAYLAFLSGLVLSGAVLLLSGALG